MGKILKNDNTGYVRSITFFRPPKKWYSCPFSSDTVFPIQIDLVFFGENRGTSKTRDNFFSDNQKSATPVRSRVIPFFHVPIHRFHIRLEIFKVGIVQYKPLYSSPVTQKNVSGSAHGDLGSNLISPNFTPQSPISLPVASPACDFDYPTGNSFPLKMKLERYFPRFFG
jgi:hypothetical protein